MAGHATDTDKKLMSDFTFEQVQQLDNLTEISERSTFHTVKTASE